MEIGSTGNHLLPVIATDVSIMQLGLILSATGLVVHRIKKWLSQYASVEEPDPTVDQRTFERLFERLFAPVGFATAKRVRSPLMTQLSYQLSVGVAVLLFATIIYVATAGLMIGTAVASYQLLGITTNFVPTYKLLVSSVVLVGLAIMFHAGDRAKELSA
ncbi:hypothetical protein [Haloferax sp. DFSO60]|uniref:hypothetical protein n=1 Tax=Haloferax sp. DFSO60 TaxID=3388652 RepID=UPI00397BDF02